MTFERRRWSFDFASDQTTTFGQLDRSMTVIFIPHNMDFAFEVSDRAPVLENGNVAGVVGMDETPQKEIVSMSMGRHTPA